MNAPKPESASGTHAGVLAALRRALLFLWAAALPIHHLPVHLPVPRAGAGEWMLPFALVAAARWMTPRGLRGALALPLLLIVGFGPSVAFSLDPRVSATQLGVLLYVAVIFLVSLQAARNGYASVVLTGFVAGVAVSCLWGWAAPNVDPWLVAGWPRPRGPTESANMLAIQGCVGAVVALVLRSEARTPRLRASWLAAAIALLVTALCTLGHVIFAALVAAAFAARQLTRGRARVVATVATLCAGAVLLLSVRVRLLSSGGFDLRPSLYAVAHPIALEVFASSPVVGVGLECFAQAWPLHDDGVRFAASYAGGWEGRIGVPLDPHSTWLGYPAEAGVFGAMTLAALVALALRARRGGARLELDVLLVFAAALGVVADVLTSRELALAIGAFVGLRGRSARG